MPLVAFSFLKKEVDGSRTEEIKNKDRKTLRLLGEINNCQIIYANGSTTPQGQLGLINGPMCL